MAVLVAAVLDARIATDWRSALDVPADFALAILAARQQSQEQMPSGPTQQKLKFDSFRDLSMQLAASGWSGVRVGDK